MIIGLTLFITTLVVQFGLTQVNAVTASPIFLFEIIVAGISAYFLANEIVHVKDFFGGLLIVLGVLISTRE
jgi:drug/metabolite transporter (DMT)-like permease